MNTGGNKIRDIAAVVRNVLYDRRAQIGVARVTRQKDGIKLGVELSVRQRHLEFILEVRYRTQSPYNCRSAEGLRALRQQPVTSDHLDVRDIADRPL